MHPHSEHTDLKEWFKFTYKHNNNSWVRIPTRLEKIKVMKILSYKKTGNALFGNCYRTEGTSVKESQNLNVFNAYKCMRVCRVCMWGRRLVVSRWLGR